MNNGMGDKMEISSTEAIIDDIRRGRMVVIMDDEDRENEGDLVMAAIHVKSEDVNFMAQHGRGLVCLTLTPERCRQLNLPLMVSDTDEKHTTNFTLSIEAATGVSTGISAADRARTIQAAVNPYAHPEDIVQPGHIFPIMAQMGGVLNRAGHTEAGCDLARLAGLEPSAVIVEILNEDGTMARRDELVRFAQHHGLKIGTVADLIRYRLQKEQTIKRQAQASIETEYGIFDLFVYEDLIDKTEHLVFARGSIRAEKTIPVRVHVQHPLIDIAGAPFSGNSLPIRKALQWMAGQSDGVVVVLFRPQRPGTLAQQVRLLGYQNSHDEMPMREDQVLRTFGVGAQILKDLGVKRMSVIGSPKRMHGLSGFGLEVEGYIDIE